MGPRIVELAIEHVIAEKKSLARGQLGTALLVATNVWYWHNENPYSVNDFEKTILERMCFCIRKGTS